MFLCSSQALAYSLRSLHVVREEGEMHVGLGAVHGARELHVGTTLGCWRERLKGPVDGEDARVVETLRKHHLHPPSTIRPYNLDAYSNRLNYKVTQHRQIHPTDLNTQEVTHTYDFIGYNCGLTITIE